MSATETLEHTLRIHLVVGLACLNAPLVRAFAGLGTRRVRELDYAAGIACTLAERLRNPFLIARNDTPVIQSRLAAVLEKCLRSLPDDLARDWAGKNTIRREAAREEIATRLMAALTERFTIARKPRP